MNQAFPKFNAWRCMRGNAGTQAANNKAACELYNNSNAGEWLLVWSVNPSCNVLTVLGSLVEPGPVLSSSVGCLASPFISGEATLAGQLYQGALGSIPTQDYTFTGGSNALQEFALVGAPIPFALLKPGYSLLVFDVNNQDAFMSASFFWQTISREELAC